MILLDTHVLLWVTTNDRRIGRKARALIERCWANEEVAVSALSFWEIELLRQRGRIELPDSTASWRKQRIDSGLIELPINGAVAIRAAGLGGLTGDPADRLIAATALEYHCELATADASVLGWQHSLVRHDASR